MSEPNQLIAGQFIGLEQSISSTLGTFVLMLQEDGNLVLCREHTDGTQRPLWSTKTEGMAAYKCVMKEDGNFILYDAGNAALWSSGMTKDRVTIYADKAFGGWGRELPIGRYNVADVGIGKDLSDRAHRQHRKGAPLPSACAQDPGCGSTEGRQGAEWADGALGVAFVEGGK